MGLKWGLVKLILPQKNWDLVLLRTFSSCSSAIVHVSWPCLVTVNISFYDMFSLRWNTNNLLNPSAFYVIDTILQDIIKQVVQHWSGVQPHQLELRDQHVQWVGLEGKRTLLILDQNRLIPMCSSLLPYSERADSLLIGWLIWLEHLLETDHELTS